MNYVLITYAVDEPWEVDIVYPYGVRKETLRFNKTFVAKFHANDDASLIKQELRTRHPDSRDITFLHRSFLDDYSASADATPAYVNQD